MVGAEHKSRTDEVRKASVNAPFPCERSMNGLIACDRIQSRLL